MDMTAAQRILSRLGKTDDDVSVQHVNPEAGEKVNVAGVAGWFGEGSAPQKGSKSVGGQAGDTFFTTSTAGYSVDGVDSGKANGSGIAAKFDETACQRARRIGGIDWQTKLVPAVRADGGKFDTPRFYIVRKDTDKALGLVGKVAAQQGKETQATLDPAPLLLQPAALDILDNLGDAFTVDRGGCIGGSVPWIQGRPIEAKMPNGDTIRIRPMVTNPLDGTGSFAIALPTEALSCRNIYASIMGSRKGVFRIKHCAAGEQRLKELQKGMAVVGRELETRLGQLATMATARADNEWIQTEFLPKMFGFDSGTPLSELGATTRNRMERWNKAYKSAPGSELNTGWGVLQATSFLTTHEWNGSHGDNHGCTDEQLWNGAAGLFEQKAVQHVRVLAGIA